MIFYDIQIDILKGSYTEMFLFQKAISDPQVHRKFIVSNSLYPKGLLFWSFFIPKGHSPKVFYYESHYSERSLLWKAFILQIIIPKGCYSEIWNSDLSE